MRQALPLCPAQASTSRLQGGVPGARPKQRRHQRRRRLLLTKGKQAPKPWNWRISGRNPLERAGPALAIPRVRCRARAGDSNHGEALSPRGATGDARGVAIARSAAQRATQQSSAVELRRVSGARGCSTGRPWHGRGPTPAAHSAKDVPVPLSNADCGSAGPGRTSSSAASARTAGSGSEALTSAQVLATA